MSIQVGGLTLNCFWLTTCLLKFACGFLPGVMKTLANVVPEESGIVNGLYGNQFLYIFLVHDM